MTALRDAGWGWVLLVVAVGIDHFELLPAHADHAALLEEIDAVDVIHLKV
jgi:hypothetical protein